MEATLYIIKDQDAYRFGFPPVVWLWEPKYMSRTLIRRVTVQLPDGFSVDENQAGEKLIFRGDEQYELSTDINEKPVIINHKENGAFIRLAILNEGWGEEDR